MPIELGSQKLRLQVALILKAKETKIDDYGNRLRFVVKVAFSESNEKNGRG